MHPVPRSTNSRRRCGGNVLRADAAMAGNHETVGCSCHARCEAESTPCVDGATLILDEREAWEGARAGQDDRRLNTLRTRAGLKRISSPALSAHPSAGRRLLAAGAPACCKVLQRCCCSPAFKKNSNTACMANCSGVAAGCMQHRFQETVTKLHAKLVHALIKIPQVPALMKVLVHVHALHM